MNMKHMFMSSKNYFLVNCLHFSVYHDHVKVDTRHHKQALHYQEAFAKDVNALIATFNELSNPFVECSGELLTLDTKDIMNEDAVKSIFSAKQLGTQQCEAFVADRIVNCQLAITDTLPRNNLVLFHTQLNKRAQNHYLKQQHSRKTVNCLLDCLLHVSQENQT